MSRRGSVARRSKQRGFIINPYRFGGSTHPNPATFSNVVLIAHGQTTPYVDSSSFEYGLENRTVTWTVGSVPSGAGGYFDTGAGNNHNNAIRVAAPATVMQLGTVWSVEAWVYHTLSGANACRILDSRASPAGAGWVLHTVAGTGYFAFTYGGVTYGNVAATVVADQTWTHVMVTYDGTDLRFFVGGVLKLTTTVALDINTGSFLTIGNTGDFTGNGFANQRLSDIRVVKGECIATASFTPRSTVHPDNGHTAIAAAPAVTFSNVKLLLPMDSDTLDKSSSAKTVTLNGSANYSATQSKFGGGSLTITGTSDYLSLADSADWDTAADFSIEFWLRRNGSQAGRNSFAQYQGTSNGMSMAIVGASNTVNYNMSGDGYDLVGTRGIADLTWTHVAISRKDGVLILFLDGVLDRFVADTTSTSSTAALNIGRLNGFSSTNFTSAYIDDFRWVKGETPYKQSFIVPSAAHPTS